RPEQVFQLVHKLSDVLEVEIDRSEAHVSDLVELLQSVHHHPTHLRTRPLAIRRFGDVRLNVVDDLFELIGWDGAPFTGFHEADHQLLPVKLLPAPSFLTIMWGISSMRS